MSRVKDDTKPVAGEDEAASGTSLTRKAALGVGAVALGGAALGGLANASGAQAATTATVPDGAPFRNALRKLTVDQTFASQAIQDPSLVTKAYPALNTLQLETLRECAILSGANVAAINKVRAAAISGTSSINHAGAVVVGGHSVGWYPTCCCCCCCVKLGSA